MTDLRRLQYFVAVARERNFTRAAERLHIAQPALSRQVRLLEPQLPASSRLACMPMWLAQLNHCKRRTGAIEMRQVVENKAALERYVDARCRLETCRRSVSASHQTRPGRYTPASCRSQARGGDAGVLTVRDGRIRAVREHMDTLYVSAAFAERV